jgi:GNAT superfamily N-acetyltransferase
MAGDDFIISDDKTRLDLDVIHGFLHEAYWSAGISRRRVARAIEHSLCFGVYEAVSDRQVGFARVITDRTVMAHLLDVFILEPYRGRGLGRRLVTAVFAHPELQNLRRWSLATDDAHELYRKFGFKPLTPAQVEMTMQKLDPDAYKRPDR